jgi:lipopolysaccharide export system protein LptC
MRDPDGVPFAGGTDRERVFRAATRHSRNVRWFRRAIPVSLLVILGGLAANAYFRPLQMVATLPGDVGQSVIAGAAGPKFNMEAPRLGGFTRDGRPYDMTARAAVQDTANPGVLELEGIVAHIAMQDSSKVEIRSATGVYDTKTEAVVLKKDVVITTTAYVVHLADAKVDNKGGRITSNSPVAVTMATGTINANGLEVLENGDLIRFTNGVETHLVPQQGPGSTNAAPAASPAPAARPATRR